MRLQHHSDTHRTYGPVISTDARLTHQRAYEAPVIYNGTASLTQIYTSVNATNWMMVYKCTRCLIFDDPSQTSFNTSTSKGSWEQGWSQSYAPPYDAANADSGFSQHNNGMGEFQIEVASATQASYSNWATLTATATAVTGSTAPTSTYSSIPVPTGTTYDYVIVGGGAGGIPMADKLSAAGHSVLLIEKGVASSARWGGSKCQHLAPIKISNVTCSNSTREWMAQWLQSHLV
jgi:cellobiose dehydrogenase (acceptor)